MISSYITREACLWILGILALGPWLACADQPPPAMVQGRAITFGQADPGHPNVGILNRPGDHYCTGTLIGSRTVLTAAHCVEASGEYSFSLDQGFYQVQEVIIHPQFIGEISLPELPGAGSLWYDNDLGLALLSTEVLGLPPADLLLEPPQVGEAITLVGCGASTQGTSRVKHRAENVIGALGDKFLLYGNTLGLTGGPATTCGGDSGGPTFIIREGQERLLGVHSMSGTACEGYGYDMRAGYFIDWISEVTGPNLGVTGDHSPPEVAFVDLPQEVPQGAALKITVEAKDELTRVVSIELQLDGQPVGSATESPASFQLPSLSVGEHELEAIATDERGNTASAEAGITVTSTVRRDGGGELLPDAMADPEDDGGGCRVGAPAGSDPPGWALVLLGLWGIRRLALALTGSRSCK